MRQFLIGLRYFLQIRYLGLYRSSVGFTPFCAFFYLFAFSCHYHRKITAFDPDSMPEFLRKLRVWFCHPDPIKELIRDPEASFPANTQKLGAGRTE